MRNNLIGWGVLLILGVAAFFVYKQRGTGTIRPDLHDFAVSDTASITKIFLADKTGQTILLERKNAKEWLIDKEHKARKDAVDVLLKTIKRVEMKAPVAKTAHDNIVKLLAGKSTKVEIYKGRKKVKTYYVGDATKDNMGTYMLIEGSATPFICHIPGFTGYLSSRYMTRPLEWRDTEIFQHRLAQIAKIEIQHFDKPERSFRITHSKDRVVQLFKIYPEETLVDRMDSAFVKRYMLNYRNVRFEGIQPYGPDRVDSIVNSPPYFSITVTDPEGEQRSVTAYRIPANPGAIDLDGNPQVWDPDRMHAVIDNNESEVMLIQYFTFDRLTIDPDWLLIDPKQRRDN